MNSTEKILKLIEKDNTLTVRQIERKTGVGRSTVHNILKAHGYKFVSKWVKE